MCYMLWQCFALHQDCLRWLNLECVSVAVSDIINDVQTLSLESVDGQGNVVIGYESSVYSLQFTVHSLQL